jgi:hypothetical protein
MIHGKDKLFLCRMQVGGFHLLTSFYPHFCEILIQTKDFRKFVKKVSYFPIDAQFHPNFAEVFRSVKKNPLNLKISKFL